MKALLTPRWIAAHVVVIVVAVVFVNLGLWQLRRLEERRLDNAVTESRYLAPPEDLTTLVAAAGDDLSSLEFRRAIVSGTYDPAQEVLIRNQVYRGQAGFHVITPLVIGDGEAVLVNRGWVPLALDTPPIDEAPPPEGELEVTGWIRPTQTRPALGPEDPATGVLAVMNRVDIPRIQQQTDLDLTPVYLVVEGSDSETLPVALAAPEFDDEGSHLAYAIQWFAFTLIGVVGYALLIRRSLSKSRPR